MSSAAKAFETTMKRVSGMLSVHPEMHGKPGRPPQHVSDILRGALVLALAALDALVTDATIEALPTLIRRGCLPDTLTDWMKEKDNRDAAARCFEHPQPVSALVHALETTTLTKSTYQRAEQIERALDCFAGCRLDWNALADELTQRRVGRRSWSAADAKARLNLFVERRNQIAHKGDVADGKRSATGIRLAYVEEASELILIVGRHVRRCISARLKTI